MRSELPPILLELVVPYVLGDMVSRALAQQLGGRSVEQVLGRFAGGPAQTGPHPSTGIQERRYPIRIPPRDGLWMTLPTVGEVGFQNKDGQLVLITPISAGDWMRQRLGGRVRAQSAVEGSLHTVVSTEPGTLLAVPLSFISVRLQIPRTP